MINVDMVYFSMLCIQFQLLVITGELYHGHVIVESAVKKKLKFHLSSALTYILQIILMHKKWLKTCIIDKVYTCLYGTYYLCLSYTSVTCMLAIAAQV